MKNHDPLSALRWFRLTATLLVNPVASRRRSPPVTVFQAIVKGVTTSFGAHDETIFFHFRNPRHFKTYRQGERIGLQVFFCRHTEEYVEHWRQALENYLADPQTGKNFSLLESSPAICRTWHDLSAEQNDSIVGNELCLEFITPLSFRPQQGKPLTHLETKQFLQGLESRFSTLFAQKVRCPDDTTAFSLLPYYWHFNNSQRHRSLSQPGTVQVLGGCVGALYLRGSLGAIYPYLLLASELHCGVKKSNSQGYFKLHTQPRGYFSRRFPDVRGVSKAISSILSRYDSALQELSSKELCPFDEVKFARELCDQINNGSYEPSPNIAFAIRKKDRTERLVERLSFRDLIVQQYLLDELSKPFDRMFEEGSIGFRKGISRQHAVKKVQEAIADGYYYVVESDIEDFFSSVDLDILAELLRCNLPSADFPLVEFLLRLIRAGYVLNGQLHHRQRGLAQGAPLSPLLANLYLDSFDEKLDRADARMIRYADDFIILTRSKSDAEQVFADSRKCLAGLGLSVNQEKTSIRPIKEGFRFLGMTFSRNEVEVSPEEDYKRYKKPLYITEPFLFLSLNGDALEIKQTRTLLDTIPMRRLSEILVMERAVFSTALIKKCVDLNIPMTLTLNTGYYVTTIKPDSKQYYEISYQHMHKYHALSDTERLSIAKEFAAGKIRNYISLFRQRYSQHVGQFIGELERIIQQIDQADTVHVVRGHEGSAAKKTYKELNRFIDNASFHIKKRVRKTPDAINSLLNFGYYLLFSRINTTVRALGLNPYLGFLHQPEDNYESLVCDIEELFRSRIDRFIIRLINLKVITAADFEQRKNGQRLTRSGVKKFLAQFETEMERKNRSNPLSLKENIYIQSHQLKKYILEDAPLTFYEWKT